MPSELRHRQRVLDASSWVSVIGFLAFGFALWGPNELRVPLALLVFAAAAAASLHALARPALLRWANPSRNVELPAEAQTLLAGTAVRSVAVTTGTISEGGEESDGLRLRVGSRVLLSPVLANVDPQRLAALALTAGTADRGVTSPTVLWACVAVLAGIDGRWAGTTGAVMLAGAFIGLGVRHAWRSRWPDDAVLERAGMNALVFSHLVLAWSMVTRSAREDPEHADHLWEVWVASARDTDARTDGITADDVDAELARLPRWGDEPPS